MTRPEAVVYDIGNVLLEWQPERFYDAEIGEAARRRMFAEVDLHAMNNEIDAGADFAATVAACAAAHPAWSREIGLWHDRWIEMASPAIPGPLILLRRLRARGVPVFALSNFGIGTFAVAERHYGFLDEFDRRFISGEMGVVKPYPEIYARLEAETGIAPDRLLFVDDREENIAAARARGWQGHVFRGTEGWAAALAEAGLLTEEEAAWA